MKTKIIYGLRAGVIYIIALTASTGLFICGLLLHSSLNTSLTAIFIAALSLAVIGAIISLIIPSVMSKKFVKSFSNRKAADMQSFILSHREKAADTAKEKLAALIKTRKDMIRYSLIFLLFGAVISFCCGALLPETSVVPVFASSLLMLCPLSFIRFPMPEASFNEDKTYVSEKDYPVIYSLAEQAKNSLGCKGKVKIALVPGDNAGIGTFGQIISVRIGAGVIAACSADELYTVLLHEFGHVVSLTKEKREEREFFMGLANDEKPKLAVLNGLAFSYYYSVYYFDHILYEFASSIGEEQFADEAMKNYSDIKTAASALKKLKYFEYYEWENRFKNAKRFYEDEKPPKDSCSEFVNDFIATSKIRGEFWNELYKKEIISRSASHPTLKMRFEALGVNGDEVEVSFDFATDKLEEERKRAVSFVDEEIYEHNLGGYGEYRKRYYTEPLQTIKKYKDGEIPFTHATYGDIAMAYNDLLEYDEMAKLCDRAIAEFDPTAARLAYYLKGSYLLSRFDDTGIEYLFRSANGGFEFTEEAMRTVGEYCCMTGNAEQLERYRKSVVELEQEEQDKYGKLSELKKNDVIAPEKDLPDNLRRGIIDYVKEVGGGCVNKVYIVRKVVSDDFFATAIVVKFASVYPAVKNEVLHKLFCYLDTVDDWQFSLFNYDNVKSVHVEKIEGSLLYEHKKQ